MLVSLIIAMTPPEFNPVEPSPIEVHETNNYSDRIESLRQVEYTFTNDTEKDIVLFLDYEQYTLKSGETVALSAIAMPRRRPLLMVSLINQASLTFNLPADYVENSFTFKLENRVLYLGKEIGDQFIYDPAVTGITNR